MLQSLLDKILGRPMTQEKFAQKFIEKSIFPGSSHAGR